MGPSFRRFVIRVSLVLAVAVYIFSTVSMTTSALSSRGIPQPDGSEEEPKHVDQTLIDLFWSAQPSDAQTNNDASSTETTNGGSSPSDASERNTIEARSVFPIVVTDQGEHLSRYLSFATQQKDRVRVRITADDVLAAANTASERAGFVIESVLPELHLIEGHVSIENMLEMELLGKEGIVSGVLPQYLPWRNAGVVTSQADAILGSARLRNYVNAQGGIDGTGIKVGVLSDSYNALGGAAAGVANNDLNPVHVLDDITGQTDEGRAMLELIHDVAPGASLAFATAWRGEASFANNILRLANPSDGNCNIIVDDVFYFSEPVFQDGVVAQAIQRAYDQWGRLYFSSSGNQAASGWDAVSPQKYVDPTFGNKDCYAFSGVDTRQLIHLDNSGSFTLALQWDQPFYTTNGVVSDLDVYIVQAGTSTVLAKADTHNIVTQQPLEILTFSYSSTGDVELVIHHYSGPQVGHLRYKLVGGGTIKEYAGAPTVSPHAASNAAMAVGACNYFNQLTPATYSSMGPATFYYNAAGARVATQTRTKPDISAIDGSDTTFFGSDYEGNGFKNFFGTSAAAPNAAAVAALVMQANPGLNNGQVYDRLRATARRPATGYNPLTMGAGLIDAWTAVMGWSVPATVPYSNSFDSSPAIGSEWELSTTASGAIISSATKSPASAPNQMLLNGLSNAGGLQEAILHVNLAGATAALLTFKQKETGSDADHALPAQFTGSVNADGVSISVDGNTWYSLRSLTGVASSQSFQQFSVNLNAAVESVGLRLSADTRIKFQHYGTGLVGFGFDDITVTAVTVTEPAVSQSPAAIVLASPSSTSAASASPSSQASASPSKPPSSSPSKAPSSSPSKAATSSPSVSRTRSPPLVGNSSTPSRTPSLTPSRMASPSRTPIRIVFPTPARG